MLEGLFDWFQSFGLAFTLLGLFLILVIDAIIFPALPELFAVLAFLVDPSLEWGLILLLTVCIAEITGNTILYSLVKWKKLPDFVEKAIKKWTGFIIFSDERIILLNRIAPVLPFTGAFIATCKWDYKNRCYTWPLEACSNIQLYLPWWPSSITASRARMPRCSACSQLQSSSA